VSKIFDNGASLREKLLKGVNTVADNVASTMGPRGRNVILYRKDKSPVITKDGVTVARFIDLDDPIENAGAQVLKQAASQTNTNAGDGTTTAAVLAREIYRNSLKYISAGSSPVELKRGMDLAVTAIVENLEEMATPITSQKDIQHIAKISANGDEVIGNLIGMAVDSVGKDGSITVEEARSLETSLDVVEGFRFDSGYAATAFITNERKGICKYEDCLVVVTDEKIEFVENMLPILEIAARESRPLLIIAEEIEGQALAALIMNSMRGTMRIVAVKAPRYGEERRNLLKDLALSVNASLISRESSVRLRDAKLNHFGLAKSVYIEKGMTTIISGECEVDEIDQRIDALKEELKQTANLHECEKIQERITRLASGVAILRVGAPTEIEMLEKKHRIEDALEAVKSAQEEGIVPGGGVALLRAAEKIRVSAKNEDQKFGVKIIKESIQAPMRQMAENTGESADLVVATVLKSPANKGWDFVDGKVVDMVKRGIVDPVKVTRCALQNAASVSSTLLTTNYAIIEG